jgi:hypothetical protein
MAEGVSSMAQSTPQNTAAPLNPDSLVPATQVALDTPAHPAPNGIHFASFGDISIAPPDLERIVQAVPNTIAAALNRNAYYFVPLALAENSAADAAPPPGHRPTREETMIAPAYTSELADLAICHRNVELPGATRKDPATDGVFISTRLLADRFALAFEFFINVGHALVDAAGVPESFAELAWNQALADVRGETSQDAWETRAQAITTSDAPSRAISLTAYPAAPSARRRGEPAPVFPPNLRVDEKARNEFLEAAFADAVAIYLLSLAVDFDYSELREREYPLLAAQALAERLRLTHSLFPPNPTYDFAIRYRRRP